MGKVNDNYIKTLDKNYDNKLHLAYYYRNGKMQCRNFSNLNEFWNEYLKQDPKQRRWYEIVSLNKDKPLRVRPYFDLEYYTDSNPEKVKQARKYLLLFQKYFAEFTGKKDIKMIILDSSGIDNKKKKKEKEFFKHSYHVIINGAGYLKSAQVAGQVAEDFAKWLGNKDRSGVFLASIIDCSVYKTWQLMRLGYSVKSCFSPGDYRVLMPMINGRKISIERLPARYRLQLFVTYTRGERGIEWKYHNVKPSTNGPVIPLNLDTKHNNKNVEYVKKLLSCYTDKRRIEYYPWIRVGIALYNVFKGNIIGLNIWNDWSKENDCPNYESSACKLKWIEFRKNRSNYSMGSLCYWAKLDNNKEYTKIVASQSYSLAYKAIANDYLTAKLIHIMFRHEVKCCVDKKGTACWYVFTGNVWEEDYRAVYLKKKISKEVTKIYKYLISQWYKQKEELANGKIPEYYTSKVNLDPATEIKKLDEMIKKGHKQMGTLTRNITKRQLIDECVLFFNDYNLAGKFNTNPNLMAFSNGVYDFQERKFRSGYPDDMITFSTKIDYIPDQDTTEIQQFMQDILPNKEVRQYVYKLLSSIFPGMIVDQVFHFFTGGGSNGKTVLGNILKYALGDYFMTTLSIMFTRKERGPEEATPLKAQLPGKRALWISESDKDAKINEVLFKRSCGGDPDIARPLFRPPFEFIPQYTPIMALNHMPTLDLMDYSLYRRTRKVDFPMKFRPKDDVDPNNPLEKAIDPKLSELSYIKMLASQLVTLLLSKIYLIYLKDGLVPPSEVIRHTKTYQEQMNPFASYANEYLERTDEESDYIELRDLFKRFSSWLYSTGKRNKDLSSIQKVAEGFSTYYFHQSPDSDGKCYKWIGFRFKQEYEMNE